MKWYFALILVLLWAVYAYAQVPPVAIESGSISEIFTEVTKLFTQWDGLSYQYRISAILFIAIGIFKNSVFLPAWEKLGKFKALVAPLLSLIAFLLMVQPFTLQTFLAAITTGAAAGYFAQVLDALKQIPTIGSALSYISSIVGTIFKKPQQ